MMIARMNRTMREDEAGQALVLGAMVMLIMALSVMVTIQLSNGINERIRVQDAADNVAFSTAAVVARSLNFISWVNRTIVSQYIAAMAAQNLLGIIDGVEAWVGMASDTMQSLSVIACGLKLIAMACCKACGAIPYVGAALAAAACFAEQMLKLAQQALEKGAEIARKAAEGIRKISDVVDPVVAFFVKMVVYLNRYGMFGAQEAMRGSTTALLAASLVDNFQKKIMKATAGDEVNKGGVGTIYDGVMAASNAGLEYAQLFDKQSGNTFGESIPDGGTTGTYQAQNGKQRAERLMAEITNASRTGPNAYPIKWETDGGISAKDFLGGGIAGEILDSIAGHIKIAGRLTMPMNSRQFTEEVAAGIDTSLIDKANKAGKDCKDSAGPAEAQRKDCEAKQKVCDSDQAKCNADQGKCNTAQAKCDSDTAQCNANPGGSACSAATSSCNNASSTCDTAKNSCDKANKSCDDAAKSCKKAEDLANDNKSKCDNAEAANGNLQQSSATASSGEKNFVWDKNDDSSNMTRGRALITAVHAKAGLGFLSYVSGGGKPKIVGVQAAHESSQRLHCRYDGRHLVPTGVCPDYAWTKAIKCENHTHHEFWGMTRYVSFNISDSSNQNYPFGQTDYLGLVNKAPKDARFKIALLGFGDNTQKMQNWARQGDTSGNSSFKWSSVESGGGGSPVNPEFHARSPGLDSMAEGLNGWARAQAYYHRPGAWAEPPNLFNPYWKARLAPIKPQIEKFTSKLPGLGGPMKALVNEVIVH